MERKKELESIITISAALLIFYFALPHIWEGKYVAHRNYLPPVALGLLVIAVLSNWLTTKIIWTWFKLAEGMGYVMSRVILSIVFFVFLFPISLLYRFFGNDPLQLRKKNGSTYTERNHTYKATDLENPW